MEIRIATKSDAESIRNIYAPYVENTAISFEYDVPSIAEFENRIEKTLENYPYLVAIKDGKIIGYAYASAFHPRVAYSHCAELSAKHKLCGYKFGKWYSVIWMDKLINNRPDKPADFIAFGRRNN